MNRDEIEEKIAYCEEIIAYHEEELDKLQELLEDAK